MTGAHRLDRKVVVVTGGGRGLGRAYAQDAAAAGAAVVVNDVSLDSAEAVAEEIRGDGGRAVACDGSVAEAYDAEALVALARDEFGRIDGLVNNAGVLTEAVAGESTVDDVRRMIEVNVVGTILCGQAAIAALRKQGGGGSIVNVTSGTHLGHPGLAVYGATKGAIASLTYGWALELYAEGIRVNAISPLAVTSMKLPPYDGHAHPEDIAAVVRYLLCDASDGVTGQIVRRARDSLGLIRHPAIGTMLTGTWRVEDIAVAFDEVLGKELEPVGYGAHVVRPDRG